VWPTLPYARDGASRQLEAGAARGRRGRFAIKSTINLRTEGTLKKISVEIFLH
jgi:hypothetical protein